jgi:hypothetical protein
MQKLLDEEVSPEILRKHEVGAKNRTVYRYRTGNHRVL